MLLLYIKYTCWIEASPYKAQGCASDFEWAAALAFYFIPGRPTRHFSLFALPGERKQPTHSRTYTLLARVNNPWDQIHALSLFVYLLMGAGLINPIFNVRRQQQGWS